MDPYLEGPLWPTVHNNLIEEIARQLAPKLEPKYLTLTSQRIVLATPDPLELGSPRSRLPDVAVFADGGNLPASPASASPAPLVLDAAMPEQMEQTLVEIRDVEEHRLVTAIELLSLTNKRGDGLDEYRRKRQEMLAGSAHFLEIDFLRSGERFPTIGTLPSVPYFVFLSRADRRPKVEIWPIAIDHPLPKVAVPLLPGDADVMLDLQAAFQSVYKIFRYDRATDHSGPPRVPVADEHVPWVEKCLRDAGLR